MSNHGNPLICFSKKRENTAASGSSVDVDGVEFVSDAYEAILQAERDGLISIMSYDEMSDIMREWNVKTIKNKYENAADHPEYRHFLRCNFPDIIKE